MESMYQYYCSALDILFLLPFGSFVSPSTAGSTPIATFLLPFGSFKKIRYKDTTYYYLYKELSTPFWEFLERVPKTVDVIVVRDFLLPFGSFTLLNSWLNQLVNVLHIFLLPFGSFGNFLYLALKHYYVFRLSTPFWEFLDADTVVSLYNPDNIAFYSLLGVSL